jgi:hypothetical protein
VAVVAGSYGGFRSLLVMIVLLFLCQFVFEGLLRTRYFVFLGVLAAAVAVVITFTADQLPMQLQRAVSILQVKVDPAVRADVIGSTQWRLDMWRTLLPEIPQYLWMGKGYAINPTDLFLAQDAAYRGLDSSYAVARVAGDYHSGPLSVILPLGVWGVIGFLWLLWSGTRALYLNYRYGNPALRPVNTFLLAFFVTRALIFLVIFGGFNAELCVFTGVLGLSVSLNGGIARKPVPARPRTALAFAAQPA